MDIKSYALWVLLISMTLPAPISAQIYKYRDNKGHLIFTDDLSKVPPDKRDDVLKYKEIEPPPVQEPDKTQPAADTRQEVSEEVIPQEEPKPQEPSADKSQRIKLEEQRVKLQEEYDSLLEKKKQLEQEDAEAMKRYRIKEKKARYRIQHKKLTREIEDLDKIIADQEKKLQSVNAQIEALTKSENREKQGSGT